uniref:Uncharacterized protein n=1 Tax=Glossina austeni TaxID=7395 RepID=A0A1A9UXM1_GLOAU
MSKDELISSSISKRNESFKVILALVAKKIKMRSVICDQSENIPCGFDGKIDTVNGRWRYSYPADMVLDEKISISNSTQQLIPQNARIIIKPIWSNGMKFDHVAVTTVNEEKQL